MDKGGTRQRQINQRAIPAKIINFQLLVYTIMKILGYLATAAICIASLGSCDGNISWNSVLSQSKTNEEVRIQKDFFGATFGDSKASTIETLTEEGYNVNETDTKSQKIRWTAAEEEEKVEFGNKEWDRFTTIYYDDKFGEIRFYLDCNDKEDEATDKFTEVEQSLSAKYGNLNQVDNPEEKVLLQKAFEHGDAKVVLTLQKLEDREQNRISKLFGKDYIYQIALSYVSLEVVKNGENEL